MGDEIPDFSEPEVNPDAEMSAGNKTKGIILAFSCLFFLSFLPVISNSRPMELTAIQFAFYLSFWEAIFALPLLGMEFKSEDRGIFASTVEKETKHRTLKIIALTAIIFSITTFLYVFSFEKGGTVSTVIALQAYPLFSILIEGITLKKRKNRGELGFTLLLVGSLYYLGTNGTWIITDISPWFGLALLVPLLWSIAHIIIRQTLHNSPITPNQITFIRVLISSIILFLVVWLTGGSRELFGGFYNPTFQFYAVIMGLFYYLELVTWFYSIKHIDVSVASSVTAITPVTTTVLAILILGDVLLTYQIVAMAITLTSLYGLLYHGRT